MLRAAWLTESSYRLGMVFSLLSLAFVVVPLYFVTKALQPVMASSIAGEGREYFAFALVGAATFSLVMAAVSALPNALASAIGRGTFETFLGTPAHPAVLFAGMSAYGLLWALVRSAVIVLAGALLGVRLVAGAAPSVLLIVTLLVLAHLALGGIAGAMLIVFRTTGPFVSGFLTGSMLLGGVYYPTHVIPSWLRDVSSVLPISYGLRALRQVALLGAPLGAVARDVAMLGLSAVVLLALAILATAAALHHARRAGTLSQY
jgi:ABC-2 type transport system permease protein